MSPPSRRTARWRRTVLQLMLWGGLALCAIAVATYWNECRELLQGIGPVGVVFLVLTFGLIWKLAVLSWQRVVAACADEAITTSVAARHLALLLLGKYLPGGVWGFVARLTDSAEHRPWSNMIAAGFCEQWLGLVSLSALSGIGLLAATHKQEAWLMALLMVPAIAIATLVPLQRAMWGIGNRLPPRWRFEGWGRVPISSNRAMWEAAVISSLQQGLVLGVVAGVAASGFAMTVEAAIAVASSYGVAVCAGILVFFVPGGIIVREALFVGLSAPWLQSAQAVALAAGLRLVFTLFDLVAGLLAGFLHARKKGNG